MFCMIASSLVFVASGTTASDIMKMVGEKGGLPTGCSKTVDGGLFHTWDDAAAVSSTTRLCAEQPKAWAHSPDPAWLQNTECFHEVFKLI